MPTSLCSKDSPVNGSLPADGLSLSSEIGRVGRPATVRQNAACPPAVVFFLRLRRPRPSLPFPGPRRLAAGTAQRLWMSIAGSSSIRRLKDVAVVLGLNELVPVGRRAPRGCDWWRLERFAKMREGLTSRVRSHPGLRPLANLRFEVSRLLPAVSSRPDVATTRWALERKLLPHPRDQLGPGNPGGVVRAGLLIRVTAAPRRATVVPIPTGRGLALLADVADRECRDGPPQLVIGRKHPWLVSRRQAMPVLPRRRDEIGEPVEELKRREFDDTVGSRPRGLSAAARPDPVGRFVSREHVADADDAAVGVADHGESFKREWWPGAVSKSSATFVMARPWPTPAPAAEIRRRGPRRASRRPRHRPDRGRSGRAACGSPSAATSSQSSTNRGCCRAAGR